MCCYVLVDTLQQPWSREQFIREDPLFLDSLAPTINENKITQELDKYFIFLVKQVIPLRSTFMKINQLKSRVYESYDSAMNAGNPPIEFKVWQKKPRQIMAQKPIGTVKYTILVNQDETVVFIIVINICMVKQPIVNYYTNTACWNDRSLIESPRRMKQY